MIASTTNINNLDDDSDEIIRSSKKADEIRQLLSEPVVDLWRLRELASTEGGLVNGESGVVIQADLFIGFG